MSDYILREYRPEDGPALLALWRQTFGDPEPLINAFLSSLPEIGLGAVAEYEGQAVGAAYSIDSLGLCSAGSFLRCGYIYAVAVSPLHRHKGLGAGLSQLAAALSRQRGAEFICTLPAEAGLYPWYEAILGLKVALYRRAYTVFPRALFPCEAIGAAEYLSRRETLLASAPHLRLSPALMAFAETFFRSFGGGLYSCPGGLCAAYIDGQRLVIRELIAASGYEPGDAAASLCAALGCESALYYLPAADGDAYISAEPGRIPAGCVWNFSFD